MSKIIVAIFNNILSSMSHATELLLWANII